MAIDSKAKRFSMMGLGSPSSRTLPPPDGSINAADRAHFLGLYSGIALSNPSAAVAALAAVRGWFGRLLRRPF